MARGTRLSEPEIARRALAAAAAVDQEGDPRQHDPGYHLIGGGRHILSPAMCGGDAAGDHIQPSSRMVQPAFQIFVMWRILPSAKSIT